MFVSEQFVYLELHKTGCTHTRKILNTVLDGELIGSHNRAPESLFDGRIFLGSVRNPWSWYVSLWAFGCRGRGELYHRLIRSNPDFWKPRYSDPDSASCFRDWLHAIMDHEMSMQVDPIYGRFPFAMIAGLMTFRYLTLFCHKRTEPIEINRLLLYSQLASYERERNFIRHFIRNESLESDIFRILDLHGVVLAEEKRSEIIALERSNQSPRLHGTPYYYDGDSERLVARKDRLIIDKFGYVAPG